MKKNFIKYLACALVAVMILGTTAFAATTTTTTYKGEYIEVTTKVTGAAENEQVTYLVHNSADDTIDDAEIIYINQKAAEGTTASFSYKVDKTKWAPATLNSTIIAGSTSGSAVASDDATIDPLEVTVTDNSGIKGLTWTVDNYLGFSEDPEVAAEKGTLTLNGVPADGTVYVNGTPYSAAIDVVGDTTYTITYVAPEIPSEPSITPSESGVETGDDEGKVTKTLFATVANLPTDGTPVEYGVKLVKNGETFYYKALTLKNDGSNQFGVKLVDTEGNIFDAEDYKISSYLKIDDVEQ